MESELYGVGYYENRYHNKHRHEPRTAYGDYILEFFYIDCNFTAVSYAVNAVYLSELIYKSVELAYAFVLYSERVGERVGFVVVGIKEVRILVAVLFAFGFERLFLRNVGNALNIIEPLNFIFCFFGLFCV